MPHLIQKIPKSNNPNNLNEDGDYLFGDALGTDIAVADGEHGCAGEVDGVDILYKIVFVLNSSVGDPIASGGQLGSTEEYNGLR